MASATSLACAVTPTQHYALLRVFNLMCRLLMNLALAYLLDTCFVRQIIRGHIFDKPLLSSEVDSRLRIYTRDANIDSGETPLQFSFRSCPYSGFLRFPFG